MVTSNGSRSKPFGPSLATIMVDPDHLSLPPHNLPNLIGSMTKLVQ